MNEVYVSCQGGLWENVPDFTLRDYKGEKDLEPEMHVELRRAGRVRV